MVTLNIHAGHLSLDNGAYAPLTFFSNLANVLDVPAEYGEYYGDDRITIGEELLPIAEELLRDNKMLYRVEGRDKVWINVHSDRVAQRLGIAQVA